MQNRLASILLPVAGLAVLGALVLGGYTILAAALASLKQLKSDPAVAIIAAAATIAVSVISVIVAKRLELRATIRQELRAKKVPIYENIISTLFRLSLAGKFGGTPMTEQEIGRFSLLTTEQLTIWGSGSVVRTYRALRGNFNAASDPKQGMLLLEELMFAIRRDLGHCNWGSQKARCSACSSATSTTSCPARSA